MRNAGIPIAFLVLVVSSRVARSAEPLLSSFVRSDPAFVDVPAFSEQLAPFPLLLPSSPSSPVSLPSQLQPLSVSALGGLLDALLNRSLVGPSDCVDAELWPARDDYGRYTWAVARWRSNSSAPFAFVPFDIPGFQWRQPVAQPVWPQLLDPNSASDNATIFVQPVFPSPWFWFSKPAFGDCLWVDAATLAPADGWLPPRLRESRAADNATRSLRCVRLPQPSRGLDASGSSRTFVATACPGTPAAVSWSSPAVAWVPDPLPAPIAAPAAPVAWPADAQQRLLGDLRALTGEELAPLPGGSLVNFTRCEADQPDNQLDLMIEWLEQRYQSLGVPAWRETVLWRGGVLFNLVARIRGSDGSLAPVVLTAHFDTAYQEDLYAESNNTQLVASRGADDNQSGTATLLLAAALLRGSAPKRDILLVHATGEEFPGDCLGARQFLTRQLQEGSEPFAVIVLDMIGWRANSSDSVFQISAGITPESSSIAEFAAQVAREVAPALTPVPMSRWSENSFLYDTDAAVFDALRWPVVLLNEHFNYYANLWRTGYHDTLDRISSMDMEYFEDTAKTTIHLTARLASYSGHAPSPSEPVEQSSLAPEAVAVPALLITAAIIATIATIT